MAHGNKLLHQLFIILVSLMGLVVSGCSSQLIEAPHSNSGTNKSNLATIIKVDALKSRKIKIPPRKATGIRRPRRVA